MCQIIRISALGSLVPDRLAGMFVVAKSVIYALVYWRLLVIAYLHSRALAYQHT